MTIATEGVTATEVVLPGIVEPDGLEIRRGAVPTPPGPGADPDGGHRGLLRRAADAPRPLLRPADVPLRARLRPGRHGAGDRPEGVAPAWPAPAWPR